MDFDMDEGIVGKWVKSFYQQSKGCEQEVENEGKNVPKQEEGESQHEGSYQARVVMKRNRDELMLSFLGVGER